MGKMADHGDVAYWVVVVEFDWVGALVASCWCERMKWVSCMGWLV